MTENSVSNHYETIIVGAGPAGLQMGYFLARAGRSYLIVEAAPMAGSFFQRYPRHRTLISLNKRFNFYSEDEYNLRHDWNSLLSDDPSLRFTKYSDQLFPAADDYARYLQDFADRLQLCIKYQTRVMSIGKRDQGGFLLQLQDGSVLRADRLMMATGPRAELLPKNIKGIEHATTYGTHSIDLKEYENKRVCIIGGKNSAFEVANHLSGTAAIITMSLRSPIKHAWNTHFPGDLRAVNNQFLDMFQLKSLHAAVSLKVTEIEKRDDGTLVLTTENDMVHWSQPTTLRAKLVVDKVILCTGFRFLDPTIFDGISPETHSDGKFPVLSPYWESTVPGLYFIGTTMQARDRVTASAFVHGFRYNVRTLFHYLEQKHHGVPLPGRQWETDQTDLLAVAQAMAERLTTADALYPLRGFLGDVLIYDGQGTIQHQYEQPLDDLLSPDSQRSIKQYEHAMLVYLEFGWTSGAARGQARRYPPDAVPLEYTLPSDHNNPACSAFLHPVFEYYHYGKLIKELHLQESLVVRFVDDDYEDFNKNINRNRICNFLSDCFHIPYQKMVEDFVPKDRRDQFYLDWSEEQLASWRMNPDKRQCPEVPFSEQQTQTAARSVSNSTADHRGGEDKK